MFKKTTYSQEEYDTEESQTPNLKHFPVIEGETFRLERRTSDLNEDDWEVVIGITYSLLILVP